MKSNKNIRWHDLCSDNSIFNFRDPQTRIIELEMRKFQRDLRFFTLRTIRAQRQKKNGVSRLTESIDSVQFSPT